MPEYLVMMQIHFPEEMPLAERRKLLEEESAAAAPWLDSGQMSRVWRTWGEHEDSHGHLALWNARDISDVESAYFGFPLVLKGYGHVSTIQPLMVNPNDRRSTPLVADAPFRLTYYNLRNWLDQQGTKSSVTNEGITAVVVEGQLWVHDHPHSGRPRELHVMASGSSGWQKIAEIGPETRGENEDVAPGYIDLLAEWDGKPVHHEQWKNRILADNGLLFSDYESALKAPRKRHHLEG